MKRLIKLSLFKKYCTDTLGSILPLTAVMLPLILGMTGVGVDASLWMMEKRNLQSAADAAAIAAAWEVANDFEEYADYAALKEAEHNGYDGDAVGSDLDLVLGTDENGDTTVTVNLQQKSKVYFSGLVFKGDIYMAAAAATAVIQQTGDYCILSLDDSVDGAVTAIGNVNINSVGCGIAVNSSSDTALDLGGNTNIDIGDVSVVGDYQTGGSVSFDYESMNTQAAKTPDPYADLAVPAYGPCDYNNFRANHDTVLNPGVYCGGITITGNNNITLNPGVYIINGGDISISGNGTLTGENVSFVLTSSDGTDYGELNISGGKVMNLSAPAEGEEMEGVLVYKDREAPEDAQCNKIVGTSEVVLDGAIYLPSSCFRIGGNHSLASSASGICSRIIAKTVELHGNPYIANDCETSASDDIGKVSVRLVL